VRGAGRRVRLVRDVVLLRAWFVLGRVVPGRIKLLDGLCETQLTGCHSREQTAPRVEQGHSAGIAAARKAACGRMTGAQQGLGGLDTLKICRLAGSSSAHAGVS
jgi:hypothetical protein